MLKSRIADLFEVRHRFVRSTHLERDFEDPEALSGYVVTPSAKTSLERLAGGLAPQSTQRAWRVTGDYGTGKSSFALALAHLFAGNDEALTPDLRRAVNYKQIGIERQQLLPVLVTGSRKRMAVSLVEGLVRSLENSASRGKRSQLLERATAAATDECGDAEAIDLLTAAAVHVKTAGKAHGLLIVLDELGKFLEFAALHPDRQDVFFLQALAEAAARSKHAPILLVGILHQGFQAYSDQLSQPAQKEWEKVAGRFEEILFNQPLDQAAALVANALNVRVNKLPKQTTDLLTQDMQRAVAIGWFGPSAGADALRQMAPKLYPLHPCLLPVLVKMFSLFGQNERSLYSFLLSDEPHALRSFADQPADSGHVFRIHHLYDYAREAFGYRLAVQSYRSHWNQIESVVESFPQEDELAVEVLKTVAVLNLINSPNLLASEDALALAVAGTDPEKVKRFRTTLNKLQRGKSVLYFRGAAGGYCLWPHTSVNLDRAYQEAVKAVPIPTNVGMTLQRDLETRPLVARRHYIETGNLRHFAITYTPPSELTGVLSQRVTGADGLIVVALCETAADRDAALRVAASASAKKRDDLLVAIPQPLCGLANLLAEVERWEWVKRNVSELAHDEFAQEEVSRQLAVARQVLEKRVRTYIGLRQFGEQTDLEWFYRGKQLNIRGGRDLLEKLSEVCDRVYDKAPRIQNELLNRHSISSAAAGARQRLIELLLTAADKPLLGMDAEKKPPEMSMYLSVLKEADLHREVEGKWSICEPPEDDDRCNLRPVLTFVLDHLDARRGGRIGLAELFTELRRPPYGLRDGFTSFLLAVFSALHSRDVAFYENGRFLSEVGSLAFQRLSKGPETFEVQYIKIGGLRTAVFEKLFRALNLGKGRADGADILDVVRPLCTFAAELPVYTQRTTSVSPDAAAVRQALTSAEEPAVLVFRQLPVALGLEEFESEDSPGRGRVQKYVDRLRLALDDLRDAYPNFVRRTIAELHATFDLPGGPVKGRGAIAAAADRVLQTVSEQRLKAFCLRLSDQGLADREWIESIGSFVCSKPPSKWLDNDITIYREDLGRLVRQFRRVESAVFATASAGGTGQAMRVAVTSQDGAEVEQVLYLDPSEETRVTELESQIAKLLSSEGRLGVVAAARAIRAKLGNGIAG